MFALECNVAVWRVPDVRGVSMMWRVSAQWCCVSVHDVWGVSTQVLSLWPPGKVRKHILPPPQAVC